MKKQLVVLCVAFAAGALFSVNVHAADGTALFKNCAACHGAEGKGTAMAPVLAGNKFVSDSTEEQLAAVIKSGRAGGAKLYKNFPLQMPAHAQLSAEDLKALAGYLKSLNKK